MLSIWCMVRRKVIGLIVSTNVMCSAIDVFCMKNRNREKLIPQFLAKN